MDERTPIGSDWELEDPSQDVRGRMVVDATGTTLGTVTDMLVDPTTETIGALVLDDDRELDMEEVRIEDDVIVYAPDDVPSAERREAGGSDRPSADQGPSR